MLQEAPQQGFNLHELTRTVGTWVTVVLAIINLIYAVKIFRYKDKKEDAQKQRDLRTAAFKNLILDQTLDAFFDFFSRIEERLLTLRDRDLSIGKKQEINQFVIDQATKLRHDFLDLLRAVSDDLYDKSLRRLDKMIDGITNDIFTDDLDLSDPKLFEEKVQGSLSSTKTSILKCLAAYDGTEDAVLDSGLSILPR